MICPHCGTRIPQEVNKCHFCGYDFTKTNGNKPSNMENSNVDKPRFLDKFIALFALLAVFISLTIYFSEISKDLAEYISPQSSTFLSNPLITGIVGVISAAFLTYFFWILAPLMIKTLIDSQKPFAGNIFEIVILLGIYFVLAGVNFMIIPPLIALLTFVILSLIFAAIYMNLSQNPIFPKKG